MSDISMLTELRAYGASVKATIKHYYRAQGQLAAPHLMWTKVVSQKALHNGGHVVCFDVVDFGALSNRTLSSLARWVCMYA